MKRRKSEVLNYRCTTENILLEWKLPLQVGNAGFKIRYSEISSIGIDF
jgi:hypothetical protein